MKNTLIKYLLALLILGSGLQAAQFLDVPDTHWASKSIKRVVELGVLAGYEDGTFRGEAQVNRYEFVIFVDNLLRVMDRRYASKESQDIFTLEFREFQEMYENDSKKYYKVTKEEWQLLLKDLEYLRAEVSELRKTVTEISTSGK